MMWRAFVGQWGYEATGRHVDVVGDWVYARRLLRAYADSFAGDDCGDCREAGRMASDELGALMAETAWRGEIDGEDLLLTPTVAA